MKSHGQKTAELPAATGEYDTEGSFRRIKSAAHNESTQIALRAAKACTILLRKAILYREYCCYHKFSVQTISGRGSVQRHLSDRSISLHKAGNAKSRYTDQTSVRGKISVQDRGSDRRSADKTTVRRKISVQD